MPWHIGKSSQCPADKPIAVIKDSDSSVSGCHPDRGSATQQLKALYAQEESKMGKRGAIGSHSTPTTEEAWDASGTIARLKPDAGATTYRKEFAWADPNANADIKSAYKIPHHQVSGDGTVGAAVSAACSAGIALLNGSRGSTDIPVGDRSAVYAHLARHLRDAGKVPVELNNHTDPDLHLRDHDHHDPDHVRTEQEIALGIERRFTTIAVEVRAIDGGDFIGGYAAVFNSTSRNLGGFVEIVTPTFFNKSRADGWPEVICRFNHDDNMLLGTTAGRTLRLQVDDYGLDYRVAPPKARADILELVQRGDVSKSSFAFVVDDDDWKLSDLGVLTRYLITGRLVDTAPVVSPAYIDTSVGMRSLAAHVGADIEEVRQLATQNELRKFFMRSGDGTPITPPRKPAPARLLGAQAQVQLLANREDPYAGQGE